MNRARLALVLLPLAACGRSRGGEHGVAPNALVNASGTAFNEPLAALSADELARHQTGDDLFDAKFVTAPAKVNPGLGPFYNNNACSACHKNDGRGQPVMAPGTGHSQLVVKLGAAAGTPDDPGGAIPVEGIGIQVQDQAVFGQTAPSHAEVQWVETPAQFADGTTISLRKPVVTVIRADGGAVIDAQTSLRQPPPLVGLGLLEAVSDEQLRAAEAASHDAGRIAGRVNEVWSRTLQATVPGRFGRKANKASVRDQVAFAMKVEIGLDNPLFPGADGSVEADASSLDALSFYMKTLAPPERRNPGHADVQRGEANFRRFGCGGCHVRDTVTGASDVPALAQQRIQPYTDLLLHEMGEGLADGRPDYQATGGEWRTAALWGVGLAQTVLPYSGYLHDGRARSLPEAILWHGGQAAGPREAFRQAPAGERADLLQFLGSL